VFRELGLGAALIQRKTLEPRHLDAVFWVNVATGLLLTGLFAAAAPLVAVFYREPALRALTTALSFNFVLGSFNIVQRSLIIRELDFRRLVLSETAATAFAGLSAAGCALAGWGVWSLVVQALSFTAAFSALTWRLSDWRPSLRFEPGAVRELMGFSANLLGFNALNFSNRNLDNLLVGRFFGPAQLGVYARAYDLMLLPSSQVTTVLSRVMFPALSSIQHDKATVKRLYMRAIGAIALFAFPMMLGLLATAEPFVLALFGEKWRGSVPVVRIFCLVGLIDSLSATRSWIFNSQGRTDVQFRWGILDFVLTTVFFFAGLPWGIEGVAWGYVACVYLQLYPRWTVAGRLIDLSFAEMAASLTGMLACAIVMSAAVALLGLALPGTWPEWSRLAVLVASGAAAYAALCHAFSVSSYLEVRRILAEHLA
jgi:PST family polysaccharide transporter